ncbi:MAG: rhomboid family intramembrane serine protease [Lentisphaeria bacterium]|nr:rhomboid family intramembrane serine protease [Lentisphaeria bacterium]
MSLYDRDYMRNRGEAPQMNGRQAMIALIVVNAVIFLLVPRGSALYDRLALTIGDGFGLDVITQIFTAGFLHAGFGHAFFNMWGIYIFGSLVAPHLNGKKFILLYLLGAAAGNLLFLLCHLTSEIPIQLVGASGAVCAVMAAAATLEPERKFVMLFLPFAPMKTTTLVICYTILEIIFSLNGGSGIAHLAHLGGFVGGYIMMRIYFRTLPWDPLKKLFATGTSYSRHSAPRPGHSDRTAAPGGGDTRVSQRELDALLDKLSTSGVNSLSEYELERLRKARRQMRGEE